MSEWIKTKLGDLIKIKSGFSYKGEFIGNGDSFLLGMGCVSFNKRFLNSGARKYSGTFSDSYTVKPGDIVLATRQQSDNLPILGFPAILPDEFKDKKVIVGTNLYKVENYSEVSNDFLFWLLKSPEYQSHIFASAKGTTVKMITKDAVESFSFNCPPLKVRNFISQTLSDIENKIELNNKINQELETLAQTLFKQWFIDFEFPNENGEPYKSSGGEMVESELGEIPKGWEIYSMDELLETVSKTYPLKKVNEVIFLNTGDIQDGKFLHKNFSKPQNLPGQAKKSINQKDILYSEIRPANKRFAYVYFNSSQYVVSTKLMVLRSKVEINSLFQYFYLTQQESIKHLQQLAESRSGTFPQITFSEVSTLKIALPNFDLVNTFVDIALNPYYDNQFQIKEENETLVELRDTLLPKLISGELEVNQLND